MNLKCGALKRGFTLLFFHQDEGTHGSTVPQTKFLRKL